MFIVINKFYCDNFIQLVFSGVNNAVPFCKNIVDWLGFSILWLLHSIAAMIAVMFFLISLFFIPIYQDFVIIKLHILITIL